MLDILRRNHNSKVILLTPDFMRDVRWFSKFLEKYNGVSIYNHKPIYYSVELDACLTGLGACWKNYVYALPIAKGYLKLGIVHFELLNVLLAIRVFGPYWHRRRVLIKCDNHTMVQVVTNSRTKDAFLAVCACNIWFTAALYDIDLVYAHILGRNVVAGILSRWQNSRENYEILHANVQDPLWIPVSYNMLSIDNDM